ncbi:MAG TPA: RidA family protein [Gemmatimonadales bacterium]|nr:RidA family protein [Gemmatimonadales bacterium]
MRVVAAFTLILAGCVVPSGGFSGQQGAEPSTRRFVNPGTMAQLDGFTHAVRIGFVTYVSGEVPLDSAGHLVGAGDLAAQAKQAFANLDLVLRIAGNVPSDVVKLTVYVVNYHPQDLAVIRQAAPEFFPEKNPPTGLVLGVQALPQEGMLIAVDAIAQAPAMFRPRAGTP